MGQQDTRKMNQQLILWSQHVSGFQPLRQFGQLNEKSEWNPKVLNGLFYLTIVLVYSLKNPNNTPDERKKRTDEIQEQSVAGASVNKRSSMKHLGTILAPSHVYNTNLLIIVTIILKVETC